MAAPPGMNGGPIRTGSGQGRREGERGMGVRVLGVGGEDAAEGLDLEGLLLLGVPPLAHLLRRRRGGLFFFPGWINWCLSKVSLVD